MSFRKLAGVAAALFALSSPQVAHAEWLEARSDHFTVIGDMPADLMQRRVERLEKFDAVIRTILPQATGTRLPVYFVANATEVRRLGHKAPSVVAYFSPSPYGVFAVAPVDAGSGMGAEEVLFHEYVHHMLLGSLDDPMPRWMNEGMAELFMKTRLEPDGSVTIGLGNDTRGYSLNRLGRWSAERMFESDLKPPRREDVDQLYAKGWLVLHYLLFSGKRPGEFGRFTTLLKQGVPQVDAARQAFGDLGKFDNELEYYRGRKSLPALPIAADKLPATGKIEIRPLGEAEVAIMPMRLRSLAGVTLEEALQVAAEARPVAERFPASAFVQRAMAEMEFDAREYDRADAAIDRALAANPAWVDAMAFKGLLTGARARREGKPELWRTARSWIVRANRAEPDNAFVLALYFDSFAAAGEVPNAAAIAGLERALVVQPAILGLRVKGALQLVALGDIKLARRVFAPLALGPHMAPDNPLAKLLAEIDTGADKAALLAKARELKVKGDNLFVQQDPADAGEKDGERKDGKEAGK